MDEKAELDDEINRLKISRRTEQANLSYTRSLLRDLQSKQDQFTRGDQQRGREEERGGKKELEQLKNGLRRYKANSECMCSHFFDMVIIISCFI